MTNAVSANFDQRIIQAFVGFYNAGDAGLDYLDGGAPLYNDLASKHGGDLDQILANIDDRTKMYLALEMENLLDHLGFDLEV